MYFPGKDTAVQRVGPWLWDTEAPGSIPAESAVLFSWAKNMMEDDQDIRYNTDCIIYVN